MLFFPVAGIVSAAQDVEEPNVTDTLNGGTPDGMPVALYHEIPKVSVFDAYISDGVAERLLNVSFGFI